jgi:uncharacterized membrane protein
MSEPAEPQFRWRDLAEVAIGASIIAFPIAVTEEIWNLGSDLSLARVLVVAAVSFVLLAAAIYLVHHHDDFPLTHRGFVVRVAATYSVTLLISACMLIAIDQFGLFEDPVVAVKRAIIVAFPASFAATLVDSFTDRPRIR